MGEFIKLQLSKHTINEVLKPLSVKPKKGMLKQIGVSQEEYEQSLAPLYAYFDACVSGC